MGKLDFIWQYVGSCIGGRLPAGDCAPLWQFGIIMLLLIFAVAGLIVVRVLTTDEPRPLPTKPPRPGQQKR